MAGPRKRPEVARWIGRQFDRRSRRSSRRARSIRSRSRAPRARTGARGAGARGCSRRRRRSARRAATRPRAGVERRSRPVERVTSSARAATNCAPAWRAASSSRPSNSARLATTSASPSSGTVTERPRAASTNRAERMRREGSRAASTASATSASARPVTPPPHGFSRGCEPSMSATRAPARARQNAARDPAGPGADDRDVRRVLARVHACGAPARCHGSRDTLHGMVEVDERRFTVGVFQDVAWAQKGLNALQARPDFPPSR